MTSYIALMRKDPSSDYSVEFPDFAGCVTAAATLEEARVMAAEVLEFHLSGMIEDGAIIPAPSTLDAVMHDPTSREAVVFLVDVATAPSRSVRINVLMPEDLLVEIRKTTNNRSRFLVEAARARLKAG